MQKLYSGEGNQMNWFDVLPLTFCGNKKLIVLITVLALPKYIIRRILHSCSKYNIRVVIHDTLSIGL